MPIVRIFTLFHNLKNINNFIHYNLYIRHSPVDRCNLLNQYLLSKPHNLGIQTNLESAHVICMFNLWKSVLSLNIFEVLIRNLISGFISHLNIVSDFISGYQLKLSHFMHIEHCLNKLIISQKQDIVSYIYVERFQNYVPHLLDLMISH